AGRRIYVLGAGRLCRGSHRCQQRTSPVEARALVLAGGTRERDWDPGSARVVGLGTALAFCSPACEGKSSESESMGRNSSACRQTRGLALSAASSRAAGGLVRLSLREDGFPAGQSRILSLQRGRYTESSAHPACSGDEAMAALRIFRSLSAYACRIVGHASSAAPRERRYPSTNSVLDTGCISFRGARVPGFHVISGRSSAGSLHA